LVTAGNTVSLFTTELRPTEITIVMLVVVLLVLLPPLSGIWLGDHSPWFLPYLIWLGIILLSYWLQRLLRKHAV